ncbi:STP1 protein [Plasmodium malariae]|uniref:STP1 protein n=1 Tax=Plasmodium malariae TaxID=5858 RepID=A0A1D3JHI1_PLAMA|nr:STP1 protein [Plasmodium malariae]SBT85854.1 STP1 protein [Plasmodium malariae]
MEKCFSSHLSVRGSSFFRFVNDHYFKNITKNIIEKTSSLNNENNKEEFRKKCLDLANYVIHNKKAPSYRNQVIWERAIKSWAESHYEKLNKYGGCPFILEEKDIEILEIKYKEVDFCEKKSQELKEIKRLKTQHSRGCNNEYLKKCREYNAWINDMKNYFDGKKSLIQNCYQKNNSRKKGSQSICNILNLETFKEPPDCLLVKSVTTCSNLEEKKKEIPSKQDPEKLEVEDKSKDIPGTGVQTQPTMDDLTQKRAQEANDNPQQSKTEQEMEASPLVQAKAEDQISLPISPNLETETNPAKSTESELSNVDSNSAYSYSQKTKAPESKVLTHDVTALTQEKNSYNTYISSILISFLIIIVSTLFINYALIGMFKKKKNIKRRHVKFLKILLTSHADKKDISLNDDHSKHSLQKDEEITKKIKIYEKDIINNTNVLKRNKNMSKTIIEVHLEVLEKCRNEEWELQKWEFLEICLQKITKEEFKTNANLTNDELIIENIISNHDIEKKKFIWNKWIEKHKNISAKLKRTHWFNNLKNEWKKEQVYAIKIKEIKNDISNDIKNVPFLEREKDLWRKWISKKYMIIEHYLEQHWLKELTDELTYTLNNYEKQETKDNISLLNIQELQNKKSYKELYKYIKKKLLIKLCILVLMTVLEECKKEEYLDNRQSYFDSSINKMKIIENLDKNKKINENITKLKEDDFENGNNKQINGYIKEDALIQDIEEEIREYDTYVNCRENVNTLKEYNHIME